MSLIAWNIRANTYYISDQQGFTHIRLSAEIFFRLRVTQNIFFVSKSHLLEYVRFLTLVWLKIMELYTKEFDFYIRRQKPWVSLLK